MTTWDPMPPAASVERRPATERCPRCAAVLPWRAQLCAECGRVVEEVVQLKLVLSTSADVRRQFGSRPGFERLFLPSSAPVAEGAVAQLQVFLPEPFGEMTLPVRVLGMAPTPSMPVTPYRLHVQLTRVGRAEQALIQEVLAAEILHPQSWVPAGARDDEAPLCEPPAPLPAAPGRPPVAGTHDDLGSVTGAAPSDEVELHVEELLRPLDAAMDSATESVAESEVSTAAVEPEAEETRPETQVARIADFVVRLARALAGAGYYDASHQGVAQSRSGLFDAFRLAVRGHQELTLLSRPAEASGSLLVHGVLQEPTELEWIMPRSQAAMAAPRLRSAFARWSLLAISLKRSLEYDEFQRLVDALAAPPVRAPAGGGLLASLLASAHVRNVSLVLEEDVEARRKLSWRVAMTVARLGRDLSALPLFEGRTPEQLRRVRLQVLGDVLRPLGEVTLVRELLLNADLIGQDLTGVARPELEELLLQCVRPELLPELLRGLTEDARSAAERRDPRLEHHCRIIRGLSRRLGPTHADISHGALRQLLRQGLIGPEELPADLRYQVGVERKADAFLTRWQEHLDLFGVLDNAGEYERHLEFFRLVLPELLARHEHAPVHRLALEIARHRLDPEPFPGRRARAGAWIDGIGASPAGTEIVWQLMSSDRVRREALLTLCGILGEGGVPLLFKALCECPTRSIRHELCELLGQLKTPTLRFLAAELERSGQPWYYERNLVGLLGRVGDASRRPMLDRFLRHEDARVRQEAVLAACALDPGDEGALLQGLDDPDREVRRVCSREAVRRRCTAPALFAYLRLCLAEARVAEEEALEACSLLAFYREGQGHEAAVDLLLEVLREEEGSARWLSRSRPQRPEPLRIAACQVLARLKPARAAATLSRVRDKGGRTLRQSAVQALRAIESA